MLARERYRKAQIVGRSKIDVWIQNWERSLKEAQKKNLGEVRDDINPAFDFLAAVEGIAPGFSDLWRDKISNWERKGKTEKIPDGFKIAQYFRDFWRTRVATDLSKDGNNPASFSASQWTPRGNNTPTLQGKTPPGIEKKCVCGAVQTKEHHWKTCQYVRHEILGEITQLDPRSMNLLSNRQKTVSKRKSSTNWYGKFLPDTKRQPLRKAKATPLTTLFTTTLRRQNILDSTQAPSSLRQLWSSEDFFNQNMSKGAAGIFRRVCDRALFSSGYGVTI